MEGMAEGGWAMSELTEHVGGRIRLYRKNKNMSMDELAAKINKSKATISKYENGDIAIDVEMLCAIATALGVSISQLTDHQTAAPVTPNTIPKGFFSNSVLYLYYYDGRGGKLTRAYIQIHYDLHTRENAATMYMDVDSFAHYTRCKYLYNGNIFIHDTVTNMLMCNQSNGIERLNILVLNPFNDSDRIYALMTSISGKPFMPVAVRCILASHTLVENDELIESLTLSRNDLKMVKKYNLFTCDPAL